MSPNGMVRLPPGRSANLAERQDRSALAARSLPLSWRNFAEMRHSVVWRLIALPVGSIVRRRCARGPSLHKWGAALFQGRTCPARCSERLRMYLPDRARSTSTYEWSLTKAARRPPPRSPLRCLRRRAAAHSHHAPGFHGATLTNRLRRRQEWARLQRTYDFTERRSRSIPAGRLPGRGAAGPRRKWSLTVSWPERHFHELCV